MAKLSTYEILAKAKEAYNQITMAEVLYNSGQERSLVEPLLVEAQVISRTLFNLGAGLGAKAGGVLNDRILRTARAMGYVNPEDTSRQMK